MRKIIASLDIGSSKIKLVVAEIIRNKCNVLACVSTPARGIKKGYVVNSESATEALIEVFTKAKDVISLDIKKVLVLVPSLYTECFLSGTTNSVSSTSKIIGIDDIIASMQKCIAGKIDDSREVVSVIPTSYKVNDEVVKNPLGMEADSFLSKNIVVTVPKKNLQGIALCLKNIGVEIVDIVISPLADYYEYHLRDDDKEVGCVVDIGEDTTTVSIFNKGILTNTEVLDVGGSMITNDLSYVFNISKEDAVLLKESIALAHTRLAEANEAMNFTNKHGENLKINQYDASEVVMGRLTEILNLCKKQINLLTKKEISYIMMVGGVVEVKDFDILLEELFGNNARMGEVLEIGARSNIYGTALGMIKYYNSRLKLKGAEFSIFDIDEEEELSGVNKSVNISDNSVLGKLFGIFFDNEGDK